MKVEARLTYDKIRHDQDFDGHLVVSLTAPELDQTDEAKRQSLCIIPVIDVSPSMIGPKFEYAKRSVIKLIDHLAPGDYCGLIQFSMNAEVIMEPTKVTAQTKDQLKRQVGDLEIGNATNIADALLKGFEVANKMDLPAKYLTRVILFTDGEANTGPAVKPKDILALVGPNMGLSSVSAFGYGKDAQQDLLADIAKKGKGNYAFVKNPDDALSAFGKELGGLLSTYATDLVLDIKPLAGHDVLEVISDVDAEKEDIGDDTTIKIPDLLAEETRHLVLKVKLKGQKQSFPRAVNVFDVAVGFDVLNATHRKEHQTTEAKAKVQFVKPGEEQEKPTAEVDQIVGLAQVIKTQIEAEEKAKAGDFQGAVQHMRGIQMDVDSRGLSSVGNIAARLGSHMGNAGSYTAHGAYFASVTRGGTRGMGVASYDAVAAADFADLGHQMSNTSQINTSSSFGTDAAGSAAPSPLLNPVGWPLATNPPVQTITSYTSLPNDKDSGADKKPSRRKASKKASKPKSGKISQQKSGRW